MTELEALTIIEDEVKKTIPSFTIDVIARDYNEKCSEYISTIVVITKDDSITPQTLEDILNKLWSDGVDDIRVVGTKKDIRDLSFEVLTLEANIHIGA